MNEWIDSLYKSIGKNGKLLKEYYRRYNESSDNDAKSHIDYFRRMQKELSFVLYQTVLERARDEHIQVDKNERNCKRMDYRNGYKLFKGAKIPGAEDLVAFIPQVRNFTKRFKPLLAFKKELPKAFEEYVVNLLTNGRSANDVKRLIATSMNFNVSKTKILSVLDRFEEERMRWNERAIKNEFPYVFIDGTWSRVRAQGQTRAMVFITAMGMKETGEKEILAFRLARSENETDAYALLRNLKARGLKDVRLVIGDDTSAFEKATKSVWVDAGYQLCQVHKLRNVVTNCANKRRVKYVLAAAKRVFDVADFETARVEAERFRARWTVDEPKATLRSTRRGAVRCFLARLEDCFAHYEVTNDLTLRRKLRSTNPLERQFREAKKRLRELGYLRSIRRGKLWFYLIVRKANKMLIAK